MASTLPSNGKHVLVVDDEPAILMVVQRILQSTGCSSAGAVSAGSALHLLEQQPCDLVITDRAMDDMNGEELAEEIKRRSPHLPVIMITGFPHLVQRRDLFTAILSKPFASDQLLAEVERVLGLDATPQRRGAKALAA